MIANDPFDWSSPEDTDFIYEITFHRTQTHPSPPNPAPKRQYRGKGWWRYLEQLPAFLLEHRYQQQQAFRRPPKKSGRGRDPGSPLSKRPSKGNKPSKRAKWGRQLP